MPSPVGNSSIRYNVGIDVGTHSVGFAAIALDDDGMPCELLNAMSLIHDSGLDPDSIKEAQTRLAVSGVARRTRRLYRRRRKRLLKLEKFLINQGWITKSFEEYSDPYFPWKARAELAAGFIADETERFEKLSVALRHIANHRGWRNPYSKVQKLYVTAPPSDQFEAIRKELSDRIGRPIPADVTVGQLISFATFGQDRLRGGGKDKDKARQKAGLPVKTAVMSARLMQSDHANEIIAICKMQGIDDELRKRITDLVFAAESPKGKQKGRVGKDPLQPGKERALKASDAFQRYRIAALIGNLRVRTVSGKRMLTKDEFAQIFELLVNLPHKQEPEWQLISDALGIDRGDLLGTATLTNDGERAGARPPVHATNRAILSFKLKSLSSWWATATEESRASMLKALSNGETEDFDSQEGALVQAFFVGLSDDDFEKLDGLHLPIGRAAYSEDTLRRLTHRMLSDGCDLRTAQEAEFHISLDWQPPAPEIGELVGNPAVDRVLKAVSRWMLAAERKWGAPEKVVIEHVRDGFVSEAQARQRTREMDKRAEKNLEVMKEMATKLGISEPYKGHLWKYRSVQRQNCQCLYCGDTITFHSAEMDHIVPRAGEGSTNTRDNLVAVCHSCNLSKKNFPFAVWAESSNKPGVSLQEALDRIENWIPDGPTREFKQFQRSVQERLKRTSADAPIDARSMESVAWMANELRTRVQQHYRENGTKVYVFRGALTAAARKASGISANLQFIDGTGKSRLDRRHHAVDAAVISTITPYIAETLEVRANKMRAEQITGYTGRWKDFHGETEGHRMEWNRWLPRIKRVALLLQEALTEDRIVVTSNLRLRLSVGRVHEDTVAAFGCDGTFKVGDALTVEQIDHASSEALWCALTRHPDFDPKTGLPADPNRAIRIHGTILGANDTINSFPISAPSLAVRGGYAKLGNSIHHARIFRISTGKKIKYAMLRVYAVDLAKHRNNDLFAVELAPQTVSVRYAEKSLRVALANGTAEYLGWIVPGDELVLDNHDGSFDALRDIETEIGTIRRWRVDGFESNIRLRLRPLQLSGEGMTKQYGKETIDLYSKEPTKIVKGIGWLVGVNPLLKKGGVTILRRDSLGQARLSSQAHLPISWKV